MHTSATPSLHSHKHRPKLIILTSIACLVTLAVIGALLFLRGGRSPHTPQNAQGSSDLISQHMLQCVPRGHDYYRTNSTLALNPRTPNIMYVGVEYKGVYKTIDGGTTWTQSDTGVRGYAMEANQSKKCIQELGRIAINPQNPQHLLLSRIETPSTSKMVFGETAGLYESKNGGTTWKQIITNSMNASGSQAIAFDPKDSKVIYYGINNGKPSFTDSNGKRPNMLFNTKGVLYKTNNGATTWEELPTGAEEGLRAMSLYVNPANSRQLWLSTFSQDPSNGAQAKAQKGLLSSQDGGKTWKNYAFPFALGNIAVAPSHFGHIYVPLQTISAPAEAHTSVDGITFQRANASMTVAAYNPHDSTGLHMLGYTPYGDAALFESKDGGKTWARFANAPSDADNKPTFGITISALQWHPTDKNIMFMSGSGGMVWKSTDSGKTWTTILSLTKIGGENKNKAGATKSSEPDQ